MSDGSRDERLVAQVGGAEEDSGAIFRPGDIFHRPANSRHGFRALPGEPFLFAVILHGGFELT